MLRKDVLIAGGGPAGSACAWRLRQLGMDCLILDKAAFPRQKTCAGWVTPDLFRLLKITPQDYPHSLTHFSAFEVAIKGVRFRLPTHQYAIRRIEFDNWLLHYAGVPCKTHHVERIIHRDSSFIVDGLYEAPFIVGAGGTHCPVRRSFFAQNDGNLEKGLIIAKEEEFPYTFRDERCHLWFFEDGLPGYAWYIPKKGGFLNVGIGGSAARLKANGQTLNQHWEYLTGKLSDLGLVTDHQFQPQGYSYRLRHKKPEARKGNAFLVGDALGLATLDMGEGISPAIQSGLLAADSIARGAAYDVQAISKFSFPSLIRIRK